MDIHIPITKFDIEHYNQKQQLKIQKENQDKFKQDEKNKSEIKRKELSNQYVEAFVIDFLQIEYPQLIKRIEQDPENNLFYASNFQGANGWIEPSCSDERVQQKLFSGSMNKWITDDKRCVLARDALNQILIPKLTPNMYFRTKFVCRCDQFGWYHLWLRKICL